MNKRIISALALLVLSMLACKVLAPSPNPAATEDLHIEDIHTQDPGSMPSNNGFPDKPAMPNDSGIEGVQTYPDKSVYHNHVDAVSEPQGDVPPAFGAHYPKWQNCGIYDQPIELGNALHSMEHGAVWLTYSPKLTNSEITNLQSLVRGHDYVLMSPYSVQTKPVVLTAWTVQLTIDSLPDDRIGKFIKFYENGPQNPEPGAPCSGAVGNPLP